MSGIQNSHQFYHDLRKANESRENDSFKTPQRKRIEKLEREAKTASETNRQKNKKLKEYQELVEKLKEEIKNMKYDYANLRDELQYFKKTYLK